MPSASSTIRLMLVDDHALVRIGLVALLQTEGDFRVVAAAASVAAQRGLLRLNE